MRHVQGNHYYIISVFLGLSGKEPELWEGPREETEERLIIDHPSIGNAGGVKLDPTGHPTALF